MRFPLTPVIRYGLVLVVLLMAVQGSVGAQVTSPHSTAPAMPRAAAGDLSSSSALPGITPLQAEAGQSAAATAQTASPVITHTVPVGPCNPTTPANISEQWWEANVNVNISLFNAANVAPIMNQVSGYAKTLVININTLKNTSVKPGFFPIISAWITVWATGWNNNTLNSTLPNDPRMFPMQIDPNNASYATTQLADAKFFPPGSNVYFNISLYENITSPYNWTSPCPIGTVAVDGTPSPPYEGIDQPTWMYHITGGWPSPWFANDVQASANPNIYNGIVPDPFQSVYFFLNSSRIGIPIGGANLIYVLHNQTGNHPGGAGFCPINSTYMESCFGGIPFGIGPYYHIGDQITFQFEAWISGALGPTFGAYDFIFSNPVTYTVGPGGTWCTPDSGYTFSSWEGSALAPFINSKWQNGNYSGGDDPATIDLHGPVVEDAFYQFTGQETPLSTSGPQPYALTTPNVVPEHPGIQLPTPPATTAASSSGPKAGTFIVNFTWNGPHPPFPTWSVQLGSQNLSNRNTWITFNEPVGAYPYTVTSPLTEYGQNLVRYVASPKVGSVSVSDANVNVVINFTQQVYVELQESTNPAVHNPWSAGNITTSPTAYGTNTGWYDNNSFVNLTAVGFFGFPFFLSLTSNTFPYVVQNSGNNSIIPPFSGVLNLTLSSRNLTTAILAAYVLFNETYNGQLYRGGVQMNQINSTVFYTGDGTQLFDPADIGPYPPGVNVSFYVLAYDELGCPIRSNIYSFHTVTGTPQVVNGRTFFYISVYDQATGQYVASVPVNISNNTWWDLTQTNLEGFAYPNATSSSSALYLAYGWYNITVTYDGSTQEIAYDLTPTSNKTVEFIFNSAHQASPVYSASQAPYSIALIAGMLVAGAVTVPVAVVWMEQRRRAEAEEKRITL